MSFLKEQKTQFIQFMLQCNVLQFGNFTTKKGRQTPYFINTGLYHTAQQIKTLSQFYAENIHHYFGNQITNLFGPAYKGIPLATAVAIQLSQQFQNNISVSFNRKEIKDHGEAGILMGNDYQTQAEKIVIIEDVVSAGTSVREVFPLLKTNPQNQILGLMISVDREERGTTKQSALQELENIFKINCHSIVKFSDIITYLKKQPSDTTSFSQIEKMEKYQLKYSCNA